MKLLQSGDKERAICDRDGLTSITYRYRDVPFSDHSGIVRNILVGVCNVCEKVISIPPQSTPAIGASRSRVQHALEVSIPAPFVDVLDAAAYRVDSQLTSDFRKRILLFYLNRYAQGEENVSELAGFSKCIGDRTSAFGKAPNRRLSFKLTDRANGRLEGLLAEVNMTKTELVKVLVLKIDQDIVKPSKPRHLAELSSIAAVLYA